MPVLPMHSIDRVAAALLLGALCSCGTNEAEDLAFTLRTTSHVAVTSRTPVVSGQNMVYFASESAQNPPMDMNGDTDTADGVAVLINMQSRSETVLGRAAVNAFVVGDEVYLIVPESEEEADYNGDADDADFGLFHWDAASESTTLVAPLRSTADGSPPECAVVEDRLYFSADATGLAAGESTLRYVATDEPEEVVAVAAEGSGIFPVELLGEEAGLLLLALDETVTPDSFNGDADQTDVFVLALCDGTDVTASIHNTQSALASASEPFAVRALSDGTWNVAYLVSEAANATEGETLSLNNSADFSADWDPENCSGLTDTDGDDNVLFFIEYDVSEAAMPFNTGIAGAEKVLATDTHVGTLSPEGDASCDLNGDGNTDDRVFRWVALAAPGAPPGQVSDMLAVANLAGTTGANVGVLSDRFVIAVSEDMDQRDHNGDGGMDFNLIAVLNPTATSTWTFEHDTGSDMMSAPYAGVSWMAEEETSGRLPMVFEERVAGANLNTFACTTTPKDNDMTDGLPAWPRINSTSTPEYTVRGSTFAVVPNNPGIVVAGAFVFFRVSESLDNRDYNNDNDMSDSILFRNPLTTCDPIAMATATSGQGDVLFTDGGGGGAYFSSETSAQVDLNQDGVVSGTIVRYFVF